MLTVGAKEKANAVAQRLSIARIANNINTGCRDDGIRCDIMRLLFRVGALLLLSGLGNTGG